MAGTVMDARLHQDSLRQSQWLDAWTELTRRILANGDDQLLDVVLCYAMRGTAADFATLAVCVTPRHLIVRAAVGAQAEPLGTIVGWDLPERTIAAQLLAEDEPVGLLSVGRLPGRASFTEPDVDHLAGFAGHAGVVLELDRLRSQPPPHADLHDHLIRELFTVCLGLQGLAPIQTRAENGARVAGYIDRLDMLIRRVRAADSPAHGRETLPHRLLAIVDDLAVPVQIQFEGWLTPPDQVADQVVAVVRGALCDVVRPAHASQVQLRVGVHDDVVTVEVVDDGRDTPERASGLARLLHSAKQLGGRMRHVTTPDGDNRLTWTTSSPVSGALRFA